MRKKCSVSLRLLVAACLTVALVPFVPTAALAWCGGAHTWATEQGTVLFRQGLGDPTSIQRDPDVPLFPELNLRSTWWNPEHPYDDDYDKQERDNWDWVTICSMKEDDVCATTLNHFWLMEEGLNECPGDIAGIDNAWEVIQPYWVLAIAAWHLGDLGGAYANLGYGTHIVQDMCVPAHANADMHIWDDALEEWLTGAASAQFFSWDGSTGPLPPELPMIYPPINNSLILADILSIPYWDPDGDVAVAPEVADEPWLPDVNPVLNVQQLFYILYVTNQIGNYFASDDEDGNTWEPIGWLGGYAGFPTALHDEDGDPISIHDQDGLIDNDSACEHGNPTGRCRENECDCDGDLTLIATWCYGAAFRAAPAVIDLFRKTVDNVPPVTTADVSRSDGQPVVEWNNSPVTVQLISATDYGNPGMRVSGVWKVWGLCDGEPPANYDAPSWGISEDGIHTVECMSTDMCGNVEQDQDIVVKIDMTPPEVTFPDLRPNYLTSENFIATWEATDALSGVASEYAWLDDEREVTKGEVIALAEMAGEHWLRVIAYDHAGNYADVFYYFEVFIDADAWTLSVIVANKTKGKAMFCIVEFPPFYDVGIIDMTTCTLAVKGTLDLTADDPVVGATAVLPAVLMTGVGDHDEDGIPDRMLRFNKKQFVAALGGEVGDIPAVVRGGLLPDGMPRFLGVVTVPVFAPPR